MRGRKSRGKRNQKTHRHTTHTHTGTAQHHRFSNKKAAQLLRSRRPRGEKNTFWSLFAPTLLCSCSLAPSFALSGRLWLSHSQHSIVGNTNTCAPYLLLLLLLRSGDFETKPNKEECVRERNPPATAIAATTTVTVTTTAAQAMATKTPATEAGSSERLRLRLRLRTMSAQHTGCPLYRPFNRNSAFNK